MKFLFTYNYNGIYEGHSINGSGSLVISTSTKVKKITTDVIEDARQVAIQNMESKGYQVNNLACMGWFKFEE